VRESGWLLSVGRLGGLGPLPSRRLVGTPSGCCSCHTRQAGDCTGSSSRACRCDSSHWTWPDLRIPGGAGRRWGGGQGGCDVIRAPFCQLAGVLLGQLGWGLGPGQPLDCGWGRDATRFLPAARVALPSRHGLFLAGSPGRIAAGPVAGPDVAEREAGRKAATGLPGSWQHQGHGWDRMFVAGGRCAGSLCQAPVIPNTGGAGWP